MALCEFPETCTNGVDIKYEGSLFLYSSCTFFCVVVETVDNFGYIHIHTYYCYY